MQYVNTVTLVGELIDTPIEKMVNQVYVVFFTLKTENEIHYIIMKDDLARKANVALRTGKIFYVVGSLSTVPVQKVCSRCNTESGNRLTRIIASDVVCLGDASHYTQKFLTLG